MSNPDLVASQRTEITADSYRRADFIRIEFPSGDVGYTSLNRDITLDTVDYIPFPITAPSGLKTSAERSPRKITLALPGTDTTLRTKIESDDYHFSLVHFFMGVFDKDWQLIGSLIPTGKGVLSSDALTIGEGSADISLSIESMTALLLRPRRVTATDADQQWRRPGDLGLNHVPFVEGSEDEWGNQLTQMSGSLQRRKGYQDER